MRSAWVRAAATGIVAVALTACGGEDRAAPDTAPLPSVGDTAGDEVGAPLAGLTFEVHRDPG